MKLKSFRINVFKTVACTDDNCYKIYMKGIDHSYYYEGYATYKTSDLGKNKIYT